MTQHKEPDPEGDTGDEASLEDADAILRLEISNDLVWSAENSLR